MHLFSFLLLPSLGSNSKTPTESRPPSAKPAGAPEEAAADGDLLAFPITSELNGRVRRLITSYQREFKKEEARKAANDKRNERRERIEQVIREREQQKIDLQQRKWSKREEGDFLKAVLAYGVEYNKREKRYVWDRFRTIAKLDKKFDDTLTDYLISLVAMCKKVTGKTITETEEVMMAGVEAISEDAASLVLERIELMNKLRDEIALHPDLEERFNLCDTALDLPDWWVPGKHDRDLLFGAARHGIARMEYFVLNDPDLSFRDILKRHLCGESLLDKKAMKEFLERKRKWNIPHEKKKKETEPKEEATEEDEKPNEEKAEEEKMEVDEKPEKSSKKKKSDRRKSSDKSKASEEAETEDVKAEEKDEVASPKKGKSKKSKDIDEDEEEEESPKVEEIKEARSRRKSTKESSQATRSSNEQIQVARADRSKKEKKREKDKEDKEREKEEEKIKEEEDKAKKAKEDKLKEEEEEKEEKIKSEEEKEKDTETSSPAPPKRNISVSIPPPQISMQQMEQMAKGGMIYDMEVMNELMAQTYAAAIMWPKDKILEIRLLHIMSAAKYGVWPVPDDYPLGDHVEEEVVEAAAEESSPAETPNPTPARDTSTPMSEVSDDASFENTPNVLTHPDARGSSKRQRGRKPLDFANEGGAGGGGGGVQQVPPSSDKTSKIRSLLAQGPDNVTDDAR
jgi:hypothetical protein